MLSLNNCKSQVLVIGGFDPTTGAGITADIEAVKESGAFPLAIPSLLTLQNTSSFYGSDLVSANYLQSAYNLLSMEFLPSVIKLGLLPINDENYLKTLKKLFDGKIVVIDPVLKATSSDKYGSISPYFKEFLSGKNVIITPNKKELRVIISTFFKEIEELSDEECAGILSSNFCRAVVLKYEGEFGKVLLAEKGALLEISFERKNLLKPVHGTGCRFASSLSAHLACGETLQGATEKACNYMSKKLESIISFESCSQDFL